MSPEELRRIYLKFWKEKEWSRYVSGSLISDLTDIRRSNDIFSWIEQNLSIWTINEIQDIYLKLKQIINEIVEESYENSCSKWISQIGSVREVLDKCLVSLVRQWIKLAFDISGNLETRNDYVFTYPDGMLAFWRLSFERRNKLVFLPGIQVEVTPFLQTLFVSKEYCEYMANIETILHQYDVGFLYEEKLEIDNDSQNEEEEQLPIQVIKTEKKPVRRKSKKKRTTLAKNFDELVKQATQPRKQRLSRGNISLSPSRRASLHPKVTHNPGRRASHSPKIAKKATPIEKKRIEPQSEHLVDFNTEAFLGPVYYITYFDSGRKPRKFGAWLMHIETDLVESHLEGKNLNISLKVPVEDVFIAQSEPVVAFCEKGSNEWKKGVFTTHTQFDQNSFILNTRLSKLGKVALFQPTDFHYPYRKWSIQFREDSTILFKLHTHFVELHFVIEGNVFYLETQVGDEFSKLRSLHHKKVSLPEMAKQLLRHGVFIFPGNETFLKHRDSVKQFELEIYVYRVICIEQLSCQSCRLNGSVAKDAALITYNNSQLHFFKKSGPGFSVTLPNDRPRMISIHSSGLASLCRWLILTRPLSLTK